MEDRPDARSPSATSDRGGIKIFGVELFGRREFSPDERVILMGVELLPISRDEAEFARR
jgi:hypothetical protein